MPPVEEKPIRNHDRKNKSERSSAAHFNFENIKVSDGASL